MKFSQLPGATKDLILIFLVVVIVMIIQVYVFTIENLEQSEEMK